MNLGRSRRLVLLILAAVLASLSHAQTSHRTTLSLNGNWEIEDSVGAEQMPTRYTHTVPVPGLAHSAQPAFADVDQYETRQLLNNLMRQGRYPKADYDKLGNIRGISHQQRNYFWYRRTFNAPEAKSVAILKVNKAQFGIVVYLNGVRIGEHFPCFSAATFDISQAIRWNRENELVIRVGAHPGVLPDNVSGGTDYEKYRWTPGIYDDVSLLTMDNPVVSTVQVAPQLSSESIVVQTQLHNYAHRTITTAVKHRVFEWKSGRASSAIVSQNVTIGPGQTATLTQRVPIHAPHLWSPEDPFLYRVETSTSGDNVSTRFGMREFHFDTVTQRAYLNGRPYFLRGSNITLHRFFEDPDVGTLPWNDAWVRRLLVEIPKSLHWNAFRFAIGPVPDHWLEIADEAGLLIENEYFVWTGVPDRGFEYPYDSQEMIGEYTEWMRDNWNHPSVVIWDATNESVLPDFTRTVIPAVRSLDLSNRPWENSYNAPAGPNDPVEDHEYLFNSRAMKNPDDPRAFQMKDLESMMGVGANDWTAKSGHSMILNEYGWLWLNRDGSPTLLTKRLYPSLMGGTSSSAEQRREMLAYLLRGETEYWRAYRRYAGVLQFVYLSTSDPQGFTSDNFLDVKSLKLEPHFQEAMRQAFNPLGVYLNFWQPKMQVGKSNDYTVLMVNDEDRERRGKLRLVFLKDGTEVSGTEIPFTLSRLGSQSYTMSLTAPAQPGRYSLRAIAVSEDRPADPTISLRNVVLEPSK